MVKRILIAIAIVAFLTSAAKAIDLCTMPVYMTVDAKVKKCFLGCVKFQVRANFDAQLGLMKNEVGKVLKDKNWDVFFREGDTIPGDGDFHEPEFCAMVSKVKKVKEPPGTRILIGMVTITFDPPEPEGDYFIQILDCEDKKVIVYQEDCGDLDLITTKATDDAYETDFNDLVVLAEAWLEM